MEEYKKNKEILDKQKIDFSKSYAMKLDINQEKDKQNELERRKEKRLKRKLREQEKEDAKHSANQVSLLESGEEDNE